MKRAKNIPPFLGGVAATLLAVSCLTTALAASGKVSYNFSNVALNGETKITAGADITAANGQKVPGTILFTDAAGGKTNYLPIRTVSELLGVEIGYDSATKTILLGGQPAETVSGRQWTRELKDGGIHYSWAGNPAQEYSSLPAFRPTALPKDWAVYDIGTSPLSAPNASIRWSYQKNGEGTLTFTCYRPNNRTCGETFGVDVDTAALRREATVQGRSADFYQIDKRTILVWEDAAGNLFWLSGTLDQTALEQIANSVKEVKESALPEFQMKNAPEGFKRSASIVTTGMVSETWEAKSGVNSTRFTWSYSREPQAAPKGTPQAVTVSGIQAQYWKGDPNASGITAVVNGEVVSTSGSEAQMSTLLWTDPETKISFRLQAPLDRDVMIRMAESISAK